MKRRALFLAREGRKEDKRVGSGPSSGDRRSLSAVGGKEREGRPILLPVSARRVRGVSSTWGRRNLERSGEEKGEKNILLWVRGAPRGGGKREKNNSWAGLQAY